MSSVPSPGWVRLRKIRRQSPALGLVERVQRPRRPGARVPLRDRRWPVGIDGQAPRRRVVAKARERELEQRQRRGAIDHLRSRTRPAPARTPRRPAGWGGRWPGEAPRRSSARPGTGGPPARLRGRRTRRTWRRSRPASSERRPSGPRRPSPRSRRLAKKARRIRLIEAKREDLLELVDQQDQPPARGGSSRSQARGHVQRVLPVLRPGRSKPNGHGRRRDAVRPAGQRPGPNGSATRPADRPRPAGAAIDIAPPQGRAAARRSPATTCRCPKRARIARNRFSWPDG